MLQALLRRKDWIIAHVPRPLRRLARQAVPHRLFSASLAKTRNPYLGTGKELRHDGSSRHRLGIVYDPLQEHVNYITACLDLDVSYEVIPLHRADWLERVRRSGCDGFLFWPATSTMLFKEMIDDRARIVERELGLPIMPSAGELYIQENKRRMHNWLAVRDIAHPRTQVFFDEAEARRFLAEAPLPQVFKTSLGASAHGVRILRDRHKADRFARRVFRRGIVPRKADPRERHWGTMLLQEYLAVVDEWRVIRIGESYFCRRKIKVGEFHSGSNAIEWTEPPPGLLDRTRELTDRGGFRSMSVDYFETRDGRYLVNEIQCLTGGKILPDDPRNGRYVRDDTAGDWRFEPGNYFKSRGAHLRFQHLLATLGEEIEFHGQYEE